MKYKATYQDNFGTEETEIYNDFKDISFKVGDLTFVGKHFDDFELKDFEKYRPEQLKRFKFKPIDIYQTNKKAYELKDFILTFSVPVVLLSLENKQTFCSNIFIKLSINSLDNHTEIFLKLVHNDKEYSGASSIFEGAAYQINEQINGEFTIKNCFWCSYSDYSVYGQELAGSMYCFLKYKDRYLNVRTKGDYMELPKDVPRVQEIYSCDSFDSRKPQTGYRG